MTRPSPSQHPGSAGMLAQGVVLSAYLVLVPVFTASCVDGRAELELRNRPAIHLAFGAQTLRLWLACTPSEMRLGLKRATARDLERRRDGTLPGMLFVYAGDRIPSFTMTDVAFNLDLALIAGDGQLLHRASMSSDSDMDYSWPEPARYAIEAPAGTLNQAGVSLGDGLLDKESAARLRQMCERSIARS